MLWNFSNFFENIHFNYHYKKKKIINPFYKKFFQNTKQKKKYFLLNQKHLKSYLLKKNSNKLLQWYYLIQNNLQLTDYPLKHLILKKKKYFYYKNLLNINGGLLPTTLSIKKKKYSNFLKTYKLFETFIFFGKEIKNFKSHMRKQRIQLGRISIRKNIYKIRKRKKFNFKYSLWNLKKSILKQYRFIKKKYIKSRINKYLILKEILKINNMNNNIKIVFKKKYSSARKIKFKFFKSKYFYLARRRTYQKKIIQRWKTIFKNKLKLKLGVKLPTTYKQKFYSKYNSNIRDMLSVKILNKKKKIFFKKYFKPTFDVSIRKTEEWFVSTHKPEKQSNPLYDSFVTNYTNGSVLYREVKNKRFSKTKKKHHNEVKYKFYIVHGPNRHEEIKNLPQKQLADKINQIKKIVEEQKAESHKPDSIHLNYILFLKTYLSLFKYKNLNNKKQKITKFIKKSLKKLKNNEKLTEKDFNNIFIKIIKQGNILNNKLLKEILKTKIIAKKFFLNLKYTWILKKILKKKLFNILKKQGHKRSTLKLLNHLHQLHNFIYSNILINTKIYKYNTFLISAVSKWKKDSYKTKVNKSCYRRVKKLSVFDKPLSLMRRLHIKKNILKLSINKKSKLTQLIKKNRLKLSNKKFLKFKYKFINYYCKLKRSKKTYFTFKKIKKSIKLNINYFENFKKKKNNRFFYFLLKNNTKLKGKLIYNNKKKKIKNFNILKKKYKKIKKLWLYFKSKFFISLHYNINLITKPIKLPFSITNFLWLNNKTYENYLLNFFFLKKQLINIKLKKKKKTFFFNFRNKRLKTYRNARKIHWKTFTTKSLNQRRYQNFLNFFLKKSDRFFSIISTIFSFKFKLSYKFWSSVSIFYNNYYKQYLIQKKKIFQLPIHTDFWYLLKFYNSYKKKIDRKILLWQSKRFRIKKTFWMQQKKKIPKFLKKKIFEVNGLKNNIQYDFITNYFVLLKSYKNQNHTNLFIFKNKYLKLHGFKYNS